jgi:hypothetical protein
VPDAAVPEIEVCGVTAVEQVHSGGEVGLGRLQKKVFVVCQKGEGVQPPTIGLHRALQPIQSPLSIRIVANDSAALVAAGHHVVQPTGRFHSQRSCHAARTPPFRLPVNA